MQTQESRTTALINFILLIVLLATVFGVMFLPQAWFRLAYNICYTAILIASFLCIPRYRRKYFQWIIVMAIAFQWTYIASNNQAVHSISKSLNSICFVVIVFIIVMRIIFSKKITALVIIQSINGYLLTGILFAMLVGLVIQFDPNAFSFSKNDPGVFDFGTRFNHYLYYSFVAFTTVGYGDVIPLSPAARFISMLASVCGPLYLTIIVAMLVGKYANASSHHDRVA